MKDDTNEILQAINHKLTTLIHLMAYQMVEGKTIAGGAPILRRLGLSASEIAGIFDSTSNTVSVLLSKAKRQRR